MMDAGGGGCGNAVPEDRPLPHRGVHCQPAAAWVSRQRLAPNGLGLGLRNPQPCRGGDPDGTSVPARRPRGRESGRGRRGEPRRWAGRAGELGGAPGAGPGRSSQDSAAPSVRSGSIFGRGITRASRLPPPWTGLFASPSRRARRAVLCRAVPRRAALIWQQLPMPVPSVGLGRAGNRKVQRAGNRSAASVGQGSFLAGGGDLWPPPVSPRKGTCRGRGGPCQPSISPRGDLAPVWDPAKHCCPPGMGGDRDAFASCSQPSRQRRGGKLGAVAWNGPAGVSSWIYYPASGCRAKVTVTNGLLHACHISSAHRGRLPALPAPVCGQPAPALPSPGGMGVNPPGASAGTLAGAGDGDGWPAQRRNPSPCRVWRPAPAASPVVLAACAMARQSWVGIPGVTAICWGFPAGGTSQGVPVSLA